jgi:hypothetical protein
MTKTIQVYSSPGKDLHRAGDDASIVDRQDWIVLCVTLGLALIFGISWVGLIAPWDHHDEPNHFQYVRMLMDHWQKPGYGQDDFHLNRQILKSMIWNGFFDRAGFEPVLPPPKSPVYLPGYSQFTEPAGYYWLAAGVAYLFKNENITRQLYGSRLLSLFFYLAAILAAWGIALDMTSRGHPLRWMVPLSLALLPGFVDMMTAVNNDAAAVVVFSFFLWVGVRLIRYGFHWIEFFLSLGLAVLSWQTKSSAAILIPLLPLVLIFSIFRGRWQWIAWSMVGSSVIGLLAFAFVRDDAAHFYRYSSSVEASRVRDAQAVLGDWVLQVDVAEPITPSWMPYYFQPVPLQTAAQFLGKPVTLGVWMWADQPITVKTPRVTTQNHEYVGTVKLSETPVFYTVEANLEEENSRLWISFDPLPATSSDARVFYDGLVLAEGIRPVDEEPVFTDAGGKSGTWAGQSFENLLRNGSFEMPGWRVRKLIDDFGARFFPDQMRVSYILASLVDWKGAGWYYQLAIQRIQATFWGYFGWAHIPLHFSWLYTLFNVLTLLGIAGAILALVQHWRTAPYALIFFFSAAVFLAGFAALTRGIIYLSYQNMFFPVARYLMPVVIPILVLFNLGWFEIWRQARDLTRQILRKPRLSFQDNFSWVSYSISALCWIALDLIAVYSVIQFYQGIPVLR